MTWDARGRGSREFTQAQYEAVKKYLLSACVGMAGLHTTEQLSANTGVEGRTVREIISQLDGMELLLGYLDKKGYFVAETQDEAEHYTGRLASQAQRMLERVIRRRRFAERLPKSQQDFGWS